VRFDRTGYTGLAARRTETRSIRHRGEIRCPCTRTNCYVATFISLAILNENAVMATFCTFNSNAGLAGLLGGGGGAQIVHKF